MECLLLEGDLNRPGSAYGGIATAIRPASRKVMGRLDLSSVAKYARPLDDTDDHTICSSSAGVPIWPPTVSRTHSMSLSQRRAGEGAD